MAGAYIGRCLLKPSRKNADAKVVAAGSASSPGAIDALSEYVTNTRPSSLTYDGQRCVIRASTRWIALRMDAVLPHDQFCRVGASPRGQITHGHGPNVAWKSLHTHSGLASMPCNAITTGLGPAAPTGGHAKSVGSRAASSVSIHAEASVGATAAATGAAATGSTTGSAALRSAGGALESWQAASKTSRLVRTPTG